MLFMFVVVAAPTTVDFAKDVAPIFAEHCVSCHNPKAKKGKYDLSTFANAMKPGESGAAIVAGKIDESPLLGMLEGKIDPAMPKNAPLLDPKVVDTVRRWIAAGCPCKEADRTRSVRELAGMPAVPSPAASNSNVSAPVLALAFHPTQPLLVVPGLRELVVVDIEKRVRKAALQTDVERTYSIKYSKDGKRLLIAGGSPGSNGAVELWDLDKASRIRRFTDLQDVVHAAAYSPDESLVAASGADRGLYVWETASGKQLHRVENHAEAAFAAQFLSDGRRIVTSSRDKTVKIWDLKQGDVSASFTNHSDAVFATAASPDGETVCTGGADGNIKYWKTSGEGKDKSVHFAHAGGVNAVAYSPDGKLVATAGADKSVKLWKASGGMQKEFPGHQDWVYSLAFSSDGKRLASGCWDGEVRVWEVSSGKPVSTFKLAELAKIKP
jgi:tricorn protease-like protein